MAMSLSHFHEGHEEEIVENSTRKYWAIFIIIFSVVLAGISFWSGYYIFLIIAFLELAWGASTYDKCRRKEERLKAIADVEVEDTVEEAVHPKNK